MAAISLGLALTASAFAPALLPAMTADALALTPADGGAVPAFAPQLARADPGRPANLSPRSRAEDYRVPVGVAASPVTRAALVVTAPPPPPPVDPAGAQAYAATQLAGHGWGPDQMSCLVSLWDRESGWNYTASNPGSGAYGIPQALPGSKMSNVAADWRTDPETQIRWGLDYIAGSYDTPCNAWAHETSAGWY